MSMDKAREALNDADDFIIECEDKQTIRSACYDWFCKHERTIREALQAGSQSKAAGRWLPIESAPRDGSRIYAWCKEWSSPMTVQLYGDYWSDHSRDHFKHQPTHFIPLSDLPATPKADAQEGG
jgi:hypothetical protein